MATPIKDTPVIFGEDAKRFMQELRNTVKSWESYTDSEREAIINTNERMKKNYDLMVLLSNGTFR